MSASQTLAWATSQLRDAGIEHPRREARLLAAHHLQTDLAGLLMFEPPFPRLPEFKWLIERRSKHEPFAYITGRQSFWKHDFAVNPSVLIPRPETELLVERAVELAPSRLLDLGTGSGAIALSILADCQQTIGVLTDCSHAALICARENASNLNLRDRSFFVVGDWALAIDAKFDLIVSNPPYVSAMEYAGLDQNVRGFEPRLALTPGIDGLGAYRQIAEQAARLLSANGRLLLEIGAKQGAAVTAILGSVGFCNLTITPDLAGLERMVEGLWPEST